MNRSTHQRATEIFSELCDLSPEDREPKLEHLARDDAPLAETVRRMLAHDGDTGTFFPTASRTVASSLGLDDAPPLVRIGRYRVTGVLGEGGMSVVYRAEQDEPVREVAVKVLRRGASSPVDPHAEGQFLANLRHPGIAQVYDAGVCDAVDRDGATRSESFIAMELIEGVPVDAHVASNGLGRDTIIRLLIDIARAVQHAHQRAIIHRDLKPANILVDADGHARILDFGIASERDARSVDTRGTLAYMAPETLRNTPANADTRVDVYALGVLAYRLLTSSLPYAIEGMGFDTAIATLRSGLPIPALVAGPKLGRGLAAVIDLAIAPDPEQRYDSAIAFADDLARVLEHRPVTARPRSPVSAARLFARRHTGASLGAALALLAIVAGLVLMSVGYVRAERARAYADTRAANQEAMAKYLEAVIFASDPDLEGANLLYVDAIASASRRISDILIDNPEAEAHTRALSGFVLRRHGRYEEARPQLTQAYRLRREVLGEDHPLTSASAQDLAVLIHEHEGRADEAIALLRPAVESLARTGENDLEELWARGALGWMLIDASDIGGATREFEAMERLVRAEFPEPFWIYRAYALHGLAECALHRGDAGRALALIDEATGLVRGAAGQSFVHGRVELAHARALLASGDPEAALSTLRIATSLLEQTVGEDHPLVSDGLVIEARAQVELGVDEAARRSLKRAHEIRHRYLASSHWKLDEAATLAEMLTLQGEGYLEGINRFRVTLDAFSAKVGLSHPTRLWILKTQAQLADEAGLASEAQLIRNWLESDRLSGLPAAR